MARAEDDKRAVAKIFKKGDIILLVLLIAAIVATVIFAVGSKDDTVEIYVEGELKYSYNLNADNEISLLDGAVTVKIKDGKAWVSQSDCNEQLCVHSSPITSSGGMIVCLPNKVVVKVTSREVDAVT